jgi:hypothetical protein
VQRPTGITILAIVSFGGGGISIVLTNVFAVIRGAITPSGVMGLLANGAVLLYLSRLDVRRALADVPTTAP